MITFRCFCESLVQRVQRVKQGKVVKKLETDSPYKIQDGRPVRMSNMEIRNRRKGSRLAARHALDQHHDKMRNREHSDHIRDLRNIEDNEANHRN